MPIPYCTRRKRSRSCCVIYNERSLLQDQAPVERLQEQRTATAIDLLTIDGTSTLTVS
jgi:hypothetical protein